MPSLACTVIISKCTYDEIRIHFERFSAIEYVDIVESHMYFFN